MINSNAPNLSTFFVLCCISGLALCALGESEKVPVEIVSDSDEYSMWVGVGDEDDADQVIQWSHQSSRDFDIEYSVSGGNPILVVLKRDFVPIIRSLPTEVLTDGISVEFSEGESLSGSVVSAKDGSVISEGLVTLQFDEARNIPLPEDIPVFAWELAEDGTFEIRGLPLGEHTVSVLAPGFMPADQTVIVEPENEPQTLQFQLAKAEYIHGRLVDYKYRSRVEGTLDVSVSPLESQTMEFQTEFDNSRNFKLGPFAEDAVVELVAHTSNQMRSHPVEVTVPTEQLVIYVHQWIQVIGSVQDQHTGEPITNFAVIIDGGYEDVTDVTDTNGQFSVEISDKFRIVSILAPGYSFWASDVIDFDLHDSEEVDLGVIELEPVHTVRGRVLNQVTREPIQGATVYRRDPVVHSPRNTHVLRWNMTEIKTTTDTDGKFQLTGFPAKGSGITVGANGYSGQNQKIEDVNLPLEIELVPSGSISGQVVSLSGEPVPARIKFAFGGIKTHDGKFHFQVSPGTHRYLAIADSGKSKVVEVTVESGQSVEGVRLVIEIVGRIYGTLRGLLDKETASIHVDGVPGSVEIGITNGSFELTGIPTGSHLVKCETNFGRELTGNVVIDETLKGQVDLTFSGSSSLSGKVVAGADGLGGYKLQAIPEIASLPVVRAESRRDGSFRFNGLVEGNYRVEIPSRNFTQRIVVQGDAHVDLHLNANRLFGNILGSGSVRGAGVRLRGVYANEEFILWTRVTADGVYSFNNIPNGTYTVQVSHPDYKEVSQEITVDQERVELNVHLDQ